MTARVKIANVRAAILTGFSLGTSPWMPRLVEIAERGAERKLLIYPRENRQ